MALSLTQRWAALSIVVGLALTLWPAGTLTAAAAPSAQATTVTLTLDPPAPQEGTRC